jgi:hypothetical protein
MVSLSWDSREGSVLVKWGKIFSFEWSKGKAFVGVLGIRKRLDHRALQRPSAIRLSHLKEAARFLRGWRVEDLEGTFSLPNPMVNGLCYGLREILDNEREDRQRRVTVNFLGENWLRGKASLSNLTLFRRFAEWFLSQAAKTKPPRCRNGHG